MRLNPFLSQSSIPNRLARYVCFLAAACGMHGELLAVNLYWDTNGSTAGGGSISNTWNSTNTFWTSNSTGGPGTLTAATTSADDLFLAFGDQSGSGAITISGTQSASSFTYTRAGNPINLGNGTGTLLIGGTGTGNGIFMNSGSSAGSQLTVSSEVRLAGSTPEVTFQNSGSSPFVVSGSVNGAATSGTTQFIKASANSASSLTFFGPIADGSGGGKVGLIVDSSGTGATELDSGSNSFTGGIAVRNGLLKLDHPAAANGQTITLGDSSTTSGGAEVSFSGSGYTTGARPSIVVSANAGNNPLKLSNFAGTGYEFSGAITLGNNLTISAAGTAGGSWSVSGEVSGSRDILVNSPSGNTVILSGGNATSNAFSGNVLVSSGTLRAGSVSGLNRSAIVISDGATFNIGSLSANIAGLQDVGGSTGGRVIGSGSGYTLTVSGNSTYSFNGVVNLQGTGSNNLVIEMGTNGKQILGGANTFNGTTRVTSGALNIRSNAGLGSTAGSTTVAIGATLELQGGISVGAETLTLDGLGVNSGGALRNISGNNSYAGNINFVSTSTRINSDADTLTLSGNITRTNQVGLIFGGQGNTLVTGTIATGGSSLNKDGSGTLTLAGANTYTGTTTISAGTLQIGNGGTTGSLNSSSTLVNNRVLVFNRSNMVTQGEDFSNVISGSGSLVKDGSGTLHLTGANTFSGATRVNSGILMLGNALALQRSAFDATNSVTGDASNGLALAPGVTSQTFAGLSGTKNLNALFTTAGNYTTLTNLFLNPVAGVSNSYSGSIADSAVGIALAKNGEGTQILSGSNSYSGGTTLTAGTLGINNDSAIGTGALTITGGTLDNTSGSARTLTTNNTQSWNGNFAFAGTNDLNLGTGAVAMSTSRTVTVSNGTLTVGGAISGVGMGLTKNGSGTLVLSGQNTFTGSTTVNAGNLTIAGGSALSDTGIITMADVAGAVLYVASSETINRLGGGGSAGGNVVLANGATLTMNQTSVATFNGTIGGGGALIKSGDSDFTLNRANTLTGGITIALGNLLMGADGALGAGSLTFDSPGTSRLNLRGTNQTITGLNFAGGIAVIQNQMHESVGTLTIDLANGVTVASNDQTYFRNGSNSESGQLAIVKTGNGTLDLSVFNSMDFSGGLTVNAGTLSHNATAALGSGSLTLGGGTLNHTGSGSVTITNSNITLAEGTSSTLRNAAGSVSVSGTIGGAGGLVKAGDGNLTLTAANTYNGSTTVNAGRLTVNATGTFGTSTLHVAGGTLDLAGKTHANTLGSLTGGALSNGTLSYDGGSFNLQNGTVNAVLAGTNGITKTTSGLVTLNSTNTYTGVTAINGGTLALATIGNGGVAGNLGNATADAANLVLGGGTLRYTGSSATTDRAFTLADGTTSSIDISQSSSSLTISGGSAASSGSLTKIGSGTLNLAGSYAYSGTTTISEGSLVVSGSLAGPASIASGATLLGTGSAASVVLNSGGSISAGNAAGTVGTLNLGAFTIAGGSTYHWDLSNVDGTGGTNWDLLNVSGALAINATADNKFLVNISGTPTGWAPTTNKSWNIINYGSLANPFDASVFNVTNNIAGGSGVWSFSNANNAINLIYTVSASFNWTGGSGNWTTGFPSLPSNNSQLVFSGSGGTATNNLATGTLSAVTTLTFNGSAGSYTLASNPGSSGFDTASPLSISGGIINNSGNLQTVNLTLNATGAMAVGANSGNIVLSGAVTGLGGLTKSGTNTATLSGNNTFTGITTIASGTLAVIGGGRLGGGSYAGNVSNNGTLLYAGTNNQTLSGVISGNGALTHNASSTLRLSGANTYNGTTTISAGTLALTGAGQLGGGAYSANITNNGAFIVSSSANNTLGGVISGSGGLTLNGSGTLTLNGTNTYTGATTINAGTLSIASLTDGGQNSRLGASSSNASNLVLGGGTLLITAAGNTASNRGFTLSNGTTSSINVQNAILATFSGNGANTNGSLVKDGAGTLRLSGSNTFTGTTSINSGTLAILSNSSLGGGNYASNIVNNGAFFLSHSSETLTLGGNISGTGLLSKTSTGTLVLTGNNSYSGGTSLAGGALQIGHNNALGSGSMTVSGGAAIMSTDGTDRTIANSFGNMGTSNYTITFGNATGQTGNLTFSAVSTLQLGANSAKTFEVFNTTTFMGNLANSASLQKTGTGTLVLAGANAYSLGTTISAGTLQIGNGGTTGSLSSTGSITNNATLAFNRSNTITQGTHFGPAITGTGNLLQNGSGILALSGTNTYTGATTVNSGTLSINSATAVASTSGIGIANGATLAYTGSSGTLDRGITITSGTGTLRNSGGGTLNLTGTLTKNGTVLTFSQGAFHVSGPIVGSNANSDLVVDNSKVTLAGNNTYNGPTLVQNGGSLILTGSIGGNASVSSGADLIGTGTASSVVVNSGASIGAGTSSGGTGTLTIGSLTLQGGGSYKWDLANLNGSAGPGWDLLNVTGALTINATSGNKFTVNLGGSPAGWAQSSSRTFNIFNYGSLGGAFDAGVFDIDSGIAGGLGVWSLANDTVAKSINLVYTVGARSDWRGGNGNWSSGFAPSPSQNSPLVFDGNGGVVTNNIPAGNLGRIAAITFNSTAGSYTLQASSNAAGANAASALALSGGVTNNSANLQTINMALQLTQTAVFDAASGNIVVGGVVAGSGGIQKDGNQTLVLSAANTFTGATTIHAGTISINAAAALDSTSGIEIANGAALAYTGASGALGRDITITNGIGTIRNSGGGTLALSGTLTKDGSVLTFAQGSFNVTGTIAGSSANSDLVVDNATVVLNGANTYNGPTYIRNAGSLTANVTNALPTENGRTAVIMDDSGSGGSTLAIGANQSVASLSGAASSNVTLGSNTLTFGTASGNTTFAGRISGSGNLVKDGNSTQVLSGSNTYTGSTTIASGTLQASSASALGSTSAVEVTGGSLLVTADDAINGKDITLASINTIGLVFDGNYTGVAGALTLSQNSMLDLGSGGVDVSFSDIIGLEYYTLKIFNWTGETLWGGSNRNNQDKIYVGENLSQIELAQISFYSDFTESSFLGNGFQLSGSGFYNNQVIPVPEAETWLAALALLGGLGFAYASRKKSHAPVD